MDSQVQSQLQPQVALDRHYSNRPEYSKQELKALREFVETIKDESRRSELVCWGDHSNYTKGW